MAIMVVIMGGMTSAILLASKAVNDGKSPTAGTVKAGNGFQEINSDLAYSLTLTNVSDKSIAFTVPDRNGDIVPEQISYSWSGVEGDPLVRQYNDGATENVVDSIHDFQITYEWITREGEGDFTHEYGDEQLLLQRECNGDITIYEVKMGKWIGDCFKPDLPDDAIGWVITRFKVQAATIRREHGSTKVVMSRADDSLLPTDDKIEEVTLLEEDLSEYLWWQEFEVSTEEILAANEGLCVVLQGQESGPSAVVVYGEGEPHWGDVTMVTSRNRGNSWESDGDNVLPVYVFGEVVFQGEPEIVEIKHVTGVGIHIQTTDDSASKIEGRVMLLNAPEIG